MNTALTQPDDDFKKAHVPPQPVPRPAPPEPAPQKQ